MSQLYSHDCISSICKNGLYQCTFWFTYLVIEKSGKEKGTEESGVSGDEEESGESGESGDEEESGESGDDEESGESGESGDEEESGESGESAEEEESGDSGESESAAVAKRNEIPSEQKGEC